MSGDDFSRTHCRDHHWRPVPGCRWYCNTVAVALTEPASPISPVRRPVQSRHSIRARVLALTLCAFAGAALAAWLTTDTNPAPWPLIVATVIAAGVVTAAVALIERTKP